MSETGGSVEIDHLTWDGVPEVVLDRPEKGSMWRRAWVNGTDTFWSFAETYRVIHNQGRGMIMQGTRDWTDYAVEADVTPHLVTSAGLAARVQGMRRYYALLLENHQGRVFASPQKVMLVLGHLGLEPRLSVSVSESGY